MKASTLISIISTILILVDIPGFPALIPARGTLISLIPGHVLDVKVSHLSYFSCNYLRSKQSEIKALLPDNFCVYVARPLQLVYDQIYFFTKNYSYSSMYNNADLLLPPKLFNLILSNKSKFQLCISGLLLIIGAIFHPIFSILGIASYYTLRREYSFEFSYLMYIILGLSILSLFLKYNYPSYKVGVNFPGKSRRLRV